MENDFLIRDVNKKITIKSCGSGPGDSLDSDVEEAINKIRKELGYIGDGEQVCFNEIELLQQALSDKDKEIEELQLAELDVNKEEQAFITKLTKKNLQYKSKLNDIEERLNCDIQSYKEDRKLCKNEEQMAKYDMALGILNSYNKIIGGKNES